MAKPIFSILVPVCNQEGNMTECVNSIKAQTLKDFEVIMVDDGSTDGSYSEMHAIEEEDERFHVYRHDKNRSLLAARYTGMEHATGEYVLFLDSDDYIEPDTLESIKGEFDKTGKDIVCFGFQFEPAKRQYLPPETKDPLKSFMLGEIPPAIWKNSYRMEVIKKALERTEPFYCNMGEDVFLAGVLFSCADSFTRLEKVLHHYIIGNGMSSQRVNLSVEKLRKAMDSVEGSAVHLTEFIQKYNPSYEESVKRAIKTMFRTVLSQYVLFTDDYTAMIRYLNEFDRGLFTETFEYGCNVLLKYKIKSDLGIEQEKIDITVG